MPIRKYVYQFYCSEYLTLNADEDGNLWCYLTVSFNKHKQFTWSHFPYARTKDIKCNVRLPDSRLIRELQFRDLII